MCVHRYTSFAEEDASPSVVFELGSLFWLCGKDKNCRVGCLGKQNVNLSLFSFLKALQKLGFVGLYKGCVVFVFTSNYIYTYIYIRIYI